MQSPIPDESVIINAEHFLQWTLKGSVWDLRAARCIYIYTFVSPCVDGSKTPPGALYCIKCLLADVFI